MATLRGKWLSDEDRSTDAARTRVQINGVDAPVLNSSPHAVDFICPAMAPGTPLEIALETRAGSSNLIHTTMQEAAPGIILLDPSPRSSALVHFSSRPAMVGIPNYRHDGQVALPGDSVTVWATGINCSDKEQRLTVSANVGNHQVPADSLEAAPDRPGTCKINLKLPESLAAGEAIPVALELVGSNGRVFRSNMASIAVGQLY